MAMERWRCWPAEGIWAGSKKDCLPISLGPRQREAERLG